MSAPSNRCETSLYLLSVLAHAYTIIVDRGVGEPLHSIEVADGLNDTDKTLSQF